MMKSGDENKERCMVEEVESLYKEESMVDLLECGYGREYFGIAHHMITEVESMRWQ